MGICTVGELPDDHACVVCGTSKLFEVPQTARSACATICHAINLEHQNLISGTPSIKKKIKKNPTTKNSGTMHTRGVCARATGG